jgi:hypothetical protein
MLQLGAAASSLVRRDFRGPWFLINVLLAVVSLSVGTNFAFGIPTVFPKGLSLNKAGVQSGYVIVNLPDGKTYAIDVNGKFAKVWTSPVADTTLGYTRPLDNGNLLAFVGHNAGLSQAVEFTQAGAIAWQYTDAADRTFHHDLTRLANGNTLIVCSRVVHYPNISDKALIDDCLVEVDPSDNIVFAWEAADHFDEFNLSDTAKAIIAATGGDWGHMNSAEEIPSNDYNDPRFKQGNIIVSFRNLNIIVIVDPTTGSIVWKSDNVTIGQHDVTMIKKGLSGAGNLLIFDNGFSDIANNPGPIPGRFYSRAAEMNPLDLSIVNEYNEGMSGLPLWWFFSPFVGSAQRLPNGNTLIDEGSDGRIFEVTPNGKIVWEWVNRILVQGFQGPSSRVYRAEKVGLTWLQP